MRTEVPVRTAFLAEKPKAHFTPLHWNLTGDSSPSPQRNARHGRRAQASSSAAAGLCGGAPQRTALQWSTRKPMDHVLRHLFTHSCFVLFFEVECYQASRAKLKCIILLHQPPKCLGYRCKPSHTVLISFYQSQT